MTIATQSAGGWIPEEEVCDRLARTIRETGISVADMASQLGVSRETISRWINGRGAPKRAALMAWAGVTGCDLHWLETGEGGERARRDSNPKPSDLVLVVSNGPARLGKPTLPANRAGRHLWAVAS